MTELENESGNSLAQKTIANIKIDTLLPEISITLNLEDFTDFSKLASLEVKKSTEVLLKEKIEKSIVDFEHDYKNIAENERYSDSYNYKLSVYYKLLGDAQKEKEYLAKIKATDNEFYNEQKAKNALLLSSNNEAQKNVQNLLNQNTAESVRSASCMFLAKGDYKGANEKIQEFLQNQKPDEEENYALLCQYGLTFALLNNLKSAVHVFRYVFYNVEWTSDVALFLAYLYRALGQNEKNPKRQMSLLKKTDQWAKMALRLNPASKQAVDFFYKTLFKTEVQYFTHFMENYVTFASTKKDPAYFTDSMNILGNCYFEEGRYADCLSVLQELTDQEHFIAGIWSNIALCNEHMGKSERALKNAQKAYSKLSPSDSQKLKNNISSIYLGYLTDSKNYKEALKVFVEQFGQTFVPRTKAEYQNICLHYLHILLATREFKSYAEYADFLWQCTSSRQDEEGYKIKECILNSKVRLFADISFSREQLELCAKEYDVLFAEYKKNHKGLPLFFNNLVYSALESGGVLNKKIENLFVSNATLNAYLCATFGLYQAKIKKNAQKCEFYYNKAVSLLKEEDFASRAEIADELKLKRDLVLEELYLEQGDKREAERLKLHIIKKCPDALWFYRERAKSIDS